MPVKVYWLEGDSLPAEFVKTGTLRVYRVVRSDGVAKDLSDPVEAAKLAFMLHNEELAALGFPPEDY